MLEHVMQLDIIEEPIWIADIGEFALVDIQTKFCFGEIGSFGRDLHAIDFAQRCDLAHLRNPAAVDHLRLNHLRNSERPLRV